jgi:hypothetical protein
MTSGSQELPASSLWDKRDGIVNLRDDAYEAELWEISLDLIYRPSKKSFTLAKNPSCSGLPER